MPLKLIDRLARLEDAQTAQDGAEALSPDLMRVWIRAVAIAFGGYPQARHTDGPDDYDSFSNGFARGLGYVDQADMETRSEADPEDWRNRMARADAALGERYGADGRSDHVEHCHVVFIGALNEWSGAKSSCSDWPADDDSDALALALVSDTVDVRRAP